MNRASFHPEDTPHEPDLAFLETASCICSL